jgi:uncharacterized membrane protein
MALRTFRERVIQTLAFETGGLLVAAPLYALASGSTGQGSLLLLALLSGAVMLWSPLHNTVFDWAEFRRTGRAASDRPPRLRLAHAVSHEASAVLLTAPLVMTTGGHGLMEALAVNLGLTALYTVYAYAFHFAYDRLRPLGAGRSRPAGPVP